MKKVLTLITLACILWVLAIAIAQGQIQLMSPELEAQFRAGLPAVEDPEIKQFFDDPTTLLYTDLEMPQAYQFNMSTDGNAANGRDFATFHDPQNNISGGQYESIKGDGFGGNANIEFPWRNPGGTDMAENNLLSYRMMWLPKSENGNPWPVIVWRARKGGQRGGQNPVLHRWRFPNGTIFGEALAVKDSKSVGHVFEVRLRVRHDDRWDMMIYRPYDSYDEFYRELKKVDPALYSTLDTNNFQVVRQTSTAPHPSPSFNVSSHSHTLPTMSEQTVLKLLKGRVFKDVSHGAWFEDGDTKIFSPTSVQDFSIVPKGYGGTFLGSDNQSCMRCHQDTLMHVDNFDARRDWYGFVRGDDNIITFNPVEPSSIADKGATLAVVLRRDFVNAGMVAMYDPSIHPTDRYTAHSQERVR